MPAKVTHKTNPQLKIKKLYKTQHINVDSKILHMFETVKFNHKVCYTLFPQNVEKNLTNVQGVFHLAKIFIFVAFDWSDILPFFYINRLRTLQKFCINNWSSSLGSGNNRPLVPKIPKSDLV